MTATQQFFTDVRFTYKDKTKTVPAAKVFQLIAVIEENMPFDKFHKCSVVPAALLSLSYLPILTFAGFEKIDLLELAQHFDGDVADCYAVIGKCWELRQIIKAPEQLLESAPGNPDEKKPELPEAAE